MNPPAEITAIVRAAVATVKAFRAMKRAKDDEASENVRQKYRKALHDALEALDRAVVKASDAAKRPNDPIDIEGMVRGVLRGIRIVEQLRGGRKPSSSDADILDIEAE